MRDFDREARDKGRRQLEKQYLDKAMAADAKAGHKSLATKILYLAALVNFSACAVWMIGSDAGPVLISNLVIAVSAAYGSGLKS